MTILTKLCKYLPKIVIPRLILKCIDDYPLLSTESCSFIVKNVSDEQPKLIRQFFIDYPEYIDLVSNIEHLTIKKNFIDVAENLKALNYENLIIGLNLSINKEITSSSDVFLDGLSELYPIFDELEELNQLSLLNSEFCSELINRVNIYCEPLSIEEFKRSDIYLKRSFHKDRSYRGRYYYILKHSLNKIILNRISKDKIDEVYNILN